MIGVLEFLTQMRFFNPNHQFRFFHDSSAPIYGILFSIIFKETVLNKQVKAMYVVTLLIIMLNGLLHSAVTIAAEPQRLSILTWSEYIDPQVVEQFSKQYNAKIDFTYFETDETRDDYLIRTDGAGYDLILTNRYALDIYQQRGWLQDVTQEMIPAMANIDNKWFAAPQKQRQYGVPYTWGTMGIAYRSDLVTNPPDSWKDLFQPDPQLRGKILMIGHSRDLLGMAAKSLGYSVNTADEKELQDIRALLLSQKKSVKSYGYISLDESSSLVTGDIWAAQVYNGDASVLQQFQPAIRYVAPKEGANIWVDLWSVASKASNRDLAYQFIDFINQGEQAAKNALYIAYATPNSAAEKLLPESYFSNPIIYPPADRLAKAEQYELLAPRVQRKWNAIYAEIVN